MKKIKKIGSLTLTLFIALSLVLSGCSKETKQESTSATEKELAPVELTWYLAGSPQAEQDKVFEAANKMIEEKINATVKFNIVDWGSYNDKMQVMLASSEPIDLCFTSNWMNDYFQNVAKGAYLPLNDLLDTYAPKLKASVPGQFWNATKVDGKIYGIINQQISTMTKGVTYTVNMAKKYNLDLSTVKKVEDLEPLMKIVKENEPEDTEVFGLNGDNNGLELLQCVGAFDFPISPKIPVVVKVDDSSLKVVNFLETEENTKLLNMLRDWYVKGYINKDAPTKKHGDTTKLKAGKSFLGAGGNVKPGGDAELSARFGVELKTVPLGQSVLFTNSIISTMHAIPIASKNPERAMMLMELLNSDKEVFNTVAFGIEGVHYNKVGENRIELVKDSKYNPGIPWEIASTFNAYLLPGQDDDVWEVTKKINAEGTPSPLLGFNVDTTNIVSQMAQCTSVYQEFAASLYTGSVNVDEVLPKFKEKMKNAGLNDIITELQKQIDAWKATK